MNSNKYKRSSNSSRHPFFNKESHKYLHPVSPISLSAVKNKFKKIRFKKKSFYEYLILCDGETKKLNKKNSRISKVFKPRLVSRASERANAPSAFKLFPPGRQKNMKDVSSWKRLWQTNKTHPNSVLWEYYWFSEHLRWVRHPHWYCFHLCWLLKIAFEDLNFLSKEKRRLEWTQKKLFQRLVDFQSLTNVFSTLGAYPVPFCCIWKKNKTVNKKNSKKTQQDAVKEKDSS